MKSGVTALLVVSMVGAGAAYAQETDPANIAAIQSAIEQWDREELSNLLQGKSAELAGEEALKARLLLMERLATLSERDQAERREAAQGLLTLFPDDDFIKALAAGEGIAVYTTTQEASTATEDDGPGSEEVAAEVVADETPAPTRVDENFESALERRAGEELVGLVLKPGFNITQLGDRVADAEEIVLAYVRPLPAANADANMQGYQALSLLRPENTTYRQKASSYEEAKAQKRASILTRMKRSTDEFNGNTFYQHPSKPRYADTRTYFLPYVGENKGRVWMRFEVHYTNDSWLFIDDASFNIDGEIVRLPVGEREWKRDNDAGEIWEWVDVNVDAAIRDLLQKIASSEKTIVRFNGTQYFDTKTIGESDKQAIRDMFLVEEVLKEKARL